jgi:ABC-type amino acid transport substrate-binding protein
MEQHFGIVRMRRLSALVSLLAGLLAVSAPLSAQNRGDLQPLPEVPPPIMAPLDSAIEPQVTIKKRDGATVEEYRINGKLYKVVITPENAPPYTLIDQSGDGSFVPMDTPGTPQLSVPMWVIGTF